MLAVAGSLSARPSLALSVKLSAPWKSGFDVYSIEPSLVSADRTVSGGIDQDRRQRVAVDIRVVLQQAAGHDAEWFIFAGRVAVLGGDRTS